MAVKPAALPCTAARCILNSIAMLQRSMDFTLVLCCAFVCKETVSLSRRKEAEMIDGYAVGPSHPRLNASFLLVERQGGDVKTPDRKHCLLSFVIFNQTSF